MKGPPLAGLRPGCSAVIGGWAPLKKRAGVLELQSGMASVAESVTARALGVKPQPREIEGGQQDVRQPLDEASEGTEKNAATA
jgi:hypothetical protein